MHHAVRAGVLLACIANAACSENVTQAVVIDKSDCVQFTNGFGSACAKWEQYGSFTIVINAPANACVINFEYPEDHSQKYYKQDGLSYIDSDNWECRVDVDSMWSATDKELMAATMTHGKLNVEYRFTSGQIVPVEFTVRSRSKGHGLGHLFGN